MKAIAIADNLAITDPNALVEIELPKPLAKGYDLLVKVNAIAVNPVDCKIRKRRPIAKGEFSVLGWDAVGEVVDIGDKVKHFKVGDSIYYAGDLNRQGCNAEYQLVDERIVGKKPTTLSNTEAAALPLTTITAWELLFDHLQIAQQNRPSEEVILVVGAAGGVGSILIQIAKVMTGATIIASASRTESQAWVKQLGADYVINHNKPLVAQIEALGVEVTHIASLNNTDAYFDSYIECLPPFGKIAIIDDPQQIDIMKLKPKSLSFHIEFMFARSMFKSKDLYKQGECLNRIAQLVDEGLIKTTLGQTLGKINAVNLIKAHEELESGRAIGKIVLEHF